MGAVTDEITTEVDQLHGRETAPGLAALAISLAETVDAATAPTGKALAAKEVRSVMAELRKLAPVGEEGDALDDLTARREARRAASA